MKKNYFILILGLCLILTSCKKEELVRLDADVEDFAGQKAYIGELDGGKYTCFEAGDVINVNGIPITITAGDIKRDGRGVTLNVSPAQTYNAVFPNSLVNSSLPNVTLPSNQKFVTDGNGRQKINIPMCGYLGSSGGSIHFHNLCALLRIVITNNLSEPIYYDYIEISSTNKPLSGSGYIDDITSAMPSIVMNSSGSYNWVKLTFDNQRELASGASITYYVVVPQAVSASGFKVSMVGQGPTVDSKYIFEKTKGGNCTFKRNEIHKIPFNGLTKTKTSFVFHYFSVSATKKVIFSPGNLQWSYTGGGNSKTTHNVVGGTADGTWRFAEKQWHLVGLGSDPSGNVSGSNNNLIDNCTTSYKGWIDMFGWGTSGKDSYYPYLSIYDNASYWQGTDLSGTNYDWGVYNDINNPVNKRTELHGTWRTLQASEWTYLVKSRTDATKLRKLSSTVNNIKGVIILPDKDCWVDPFNNSSKTTYSEAEWKQMENNGAVFMPTCGYRNGTAQGDDNTQWKYNCATLTCLYTTNGNFTTADGCGRRQGKAVRLVKDYTPGQ